MAEDQKQEIQATKTTIESIRVHIAEKVEGITTTDPVIGALFHLDIAIMHETTVPTGTNTKHHLWGSVLPEGESYTDLCQALAIRHGVNIDCKF